MPTAWTVSAAVRARSSPQPARPSPAPKESTRAPFRPTRLGMNTRWAGNGRYVRSLNCVASPPRNMSTPYSSTSSTVAASTPAAPPLSRTCSHPTRRRRGRPCRTTRGTASQDRPWPPGVQHVLQGADPVAPDRRQGGPSRHGTHRSAASDSRVNAPAALPPPQVVLSYGSASTTAAPTPARQTAHSRLLPGYKAAAPTLSAITGPGRASPVPAATSERSTPSTPRSPARLNPGSTPLPRPRPHLRF